MLSEGKGGEHGRRIVERAHFREVYHTGETPDLLELDRLNKVRDLLGNLVQ